MVLRGSRKNWSSCSRPGCSTDNHTGSSGCETQGLPTLLQASPEPGLGKSPGFLQARFVNKDPSTQDEIQPMRVLGFGASLAVVSSAHHTGSWSCEVARPLFGR